MGLQAGPCGTRHDNDSKLEGTHGDAGAGCPGSDREPRRENRQAARGAWIAAAKRSGLARHGEIVKMLKTDHGMGHGYANLVAHKVLAGDAGSRGEVDLNVMVTHRVRIEDAAAVDAEMIGWLRRAYDES